MDQLLSHAIFSSLFAVIGFALGRWLQTRERVGLAPASASEASFHYDIVNGLHNLSLRLAADVGEHHARVGEVDRELSSEPSPTGTTLGSLVQRLMKANDEVQAKLATAETRLDEMNQRLAYHTAEARTDLLTGLANRRVFEDELSRLLSLYRESNEPFSVVIVDIDHFKRFNDQYGHAVGDEVLRSVSTMLASKIDSHDLVTRYGGEEFAFLMPGTSMETACGNAERLRRIIEELPVVCGSESLQVTISAGVAEILPSEDRTAVVARADQAMYAAKYAGRNRVFWHDGARALALPELENPMRTDDSTHEFATLKFRPLTVEETPPAVASTEEPKRVPAIANEELVGPEAIDLDVLANLSNKTMFCQNVHRRVVEWKRGGPTFSIVLLSVDNFAALAKEHGQAIVDYTLGVVARSIRFNLRGMDTVARYDEHTFGVVLPGAKLRNTVCIGERLRKDIRRTGISVDAQVVHFTVSLGIVEVGEGDEMASLLERANQQLRIASQNGGDRTGFASRNVVAS
jgi:diguanylate cyclase (GGDEF)-like protein